ncbi:DUF2919 domain-containing protein [Vibrio sagamiensis]|uniref:Membrane protein n=1 Tax=Vibrio sagamiensis NBRC 104589 TaxID=1219064 RepID=A0A511QA07_9VIBR|nr:DUF2919 domain-containing protein [Vibrio sagamiensis]PNQ61491.1 DUF2919 domain-containing protein [Vibrio agarivorans]GEM74133.1 membrane protein [Vibrio sagamiensis NBRC 104589]
MRYALDDYDAHGFLKAPKLLWLGWMFLARSWGVFVMAGVSRDNGSKVLSMVYPDSSTLYLGLAMGIPSVLLMWLMGLRHADRKWVSQITQRGRAITLILCAIQLVQTMYHIYLEHGVFSWPNALSMILLSWFMLYLLSGKWVRDCFRVPQLEP